MNKNILLTMLAAGLALAWAGCKKTEKPAVLGPLPTGPAELKLQWPLDMQFVHRFEIKQNGDITVPGLPQPIKQDMSMTQTMAVSVKKGADDGREIDLKLTALTIRVDRANQTMLDFDSSKRAGSDPLSGVLGKATGLRVELALDASNRVQSVQGVKDFTGELESLAGRDQSGAAQTLSSLFGEQFFKEVFDHTPNMPSKAVAPGDTWPVHREIDMGQLGTVIVDATNTLVDWEVHNHHNCAHITFEGTMARAGGGGPMPGGVSVDLKDGTDSGDTWFDLDRGLYIDSAITEKMNLGITVPGGGGGRVNAGGATQKLQMALNQQITARLDPAN